MPTFLVAPGTRNPIGASEIEHHDKSRHGLHQNDLAECGTCGRVWCITCFPTPSTRCPFEYEHGDDDPDGPEPDDDAPLSRDPAPIELSPEDPADAVLAVFAELIREHQAGRIVTLTFARAD